MNQPYKLGTNLAAGIPVIVKKGCVHEEFVVKNGLRKWIISWSLRIRTE